MTTIPGKMTTSGVKVNKWLRLVHEALFSLNTAGYIEATVLTWWPDSRLHLFRFIFANRYGRWLVPPGATETAELAEVLLWLALAAGIFITLGLFADSSLTHLLLDTVAGLIAIAGLPFAALCLESSPYRYLSATAVHSLPFEVVLVLLLGFGYMRRRWAVLEPFLFSCVLALHFAIWVWASWPEYNPDPGVFLNNGAGWFWHFLQVLPVLGPSLGFCASVAWGLYVREGETGGTGSRRGGRGQEPLFCRSS